MRLINRRYTLWALVALAVLSWGQVQAVVHIHHAHHDGLLPIEISVHPIDFDAEGLPGHHDGEDHHHSFDRDNSKWFLVRSQQTRFIVLQSPIYAIVSPESTVGQIDGVAVEPTESVTIVAQWTQFPADPRGPPHNS